MRVGHLFSRLHTRPLPTTFCPELGEIFSPRCGALSCPNVFKRWRYVSAARNRRPNIDVGLLIKDGRIEVNGRHYPVDEWTNLSPNVLSKLGSNLHAQPHHPLFLLRKKIERFFEQNQKDFVLHKDDSIHSVFDNLNPVVTTEMNFDDLLVPLDHVSRKNTDSYYINEKMMLRAHTSAHQKDLIRSGLNSFLLVGDVYRRDWIDKNHYPVFHQMEGVRLFSDVQLFKDQSGRKVEGLKLFEDNGSRTPSKQQHHSSETAKMLEFHLKSTLTGLAHYLFGKKIDIRWVDAYFPFTHPSWEMEVFYDDDWLEVLGCGVVEQPIISSAGVENRVGWAFGLGLERLAMVLFGIPDIRLFWTTDSGFVSQFEGKTPEDYFKFVPISKFPQIFNDMSFWLPEESSDFDSNDFCEIVRAVGGDVIEQVKLFDEFYHPKTRRWSHAYRIVYRHMSRALTQSEVNDIHAEIAVEAERLLAVDVRNKT